MTLKPGRYLQPVAVAQAASALIIRLFAGCRTTDKSSGRTLYAEIPVEHWSYPSWIDPHEAEQARCATLPCSDPHKQYLSSVRPGVGLLSAS